MTLDYGIRDPVANSYSRINLHSYQHFPNGNRLLHAEFNGKRLVEYEYDDLYRLTEERVTDSTYGNRTSNWTYDAVGNRLTQIESNLTGNVNTTYTYDDNDRLTSEVVTGLITDSTSYTYDNNGNTLTKIDGTGTTTYAYDSRNRLSDLNSGLITYQYDASGIRMSETSSGGLATHYLVDPNRSYAQVIEESFDLNNFAEVKYTYGDDLLAQHRRVDAITTNTSIYHQDGIGSTRALTDMSGTLTDEYAFSAFGELDGSVGVTVNDYLYTGEQFDPNLGFYYLRARYYNQAVGRFQNMDTFAGRMFEPVTLHKYLYANVDPVGMVDPSGRVSLGELSSTIGNISRLAVRGVANLGRTFTRSVNRTLRKVRQIGKRKKNPKKGRKDNDDVVGFDEARVMLEAFVGAGFPIITEIGDSPRLNAVWSKGVWIKMEHRRRIRDKVIVVHYFLNINNRQRVEFKFKRRF